MKFEDNVPLIFQDTILYMINKQRKRILLGVQGSQEGHQTGGGEGGGGSQTEMIILRRREFCARDLVRRPSYLMIISKNQSKLGKFSV